MSSSASMVLEVRRRIENIKEEKIRHAFMYLFLIGGEVSEVCGKYAPIGNDANKIEYKINDRYIPAVLFIVHNTRITPNKKNHHRGCVLPLNKEYEPWTNQVYEWFKKYPDKNPFEISLKSNNPETHKRNLGWKADEIFEGLKWIKDPYYNEGIVDRRKTKFLASSLSELRIRNLREFYNFNEIDFTIFAGKKYYSKYDPEVNERIEEIISSNIEKKEINKFIALSQSYFNKLLIPLSFLENTISRSELIRESPELNRQFNTAINLTKSIKEINELFIDRLDSPFFKENMGLIVIMLSPCNTDAEFAQHIGSLRSIFEIDIGQLKKAVKSLPDDAKSIKWAETWFMENKINKTSSIIETWKKITSFRNAYGGFHSETDPKILSDAFRYFGERFILPFNNYQRLWNNVLAKFQISLNELQQILNDYEKSSDNN